MSKGYELIINFAGDSGDGMQLVGQQFTLSASAEGLQVQTYPDFPAEIRAPAGTVAGVSGYQVAVADLPLYTAGDAVDVLVAMNPAALVHCLPNVRHGALLILDSDSFTPRDFKKASLGAEYYKEGALNDFQVIEAPITSQTLASLKSSNLSQSQQKKAKNFYALGMLLWLFDFKVDTTLDFIQSKFKAMPAVVDANILSLKAGFNYALTMELAQFERDYQPKADTTIGKQISGIDALAKALAVIAVKSNTPLLLSGYPITPASGLLHEAIKLADFGVSVFQAEDEIAAVCATLGAAFAGKLALTCTSGPGLDLKAEGLGLGVMTELPLVVIDVMRSGPSTGLPTKNEQSDLFAALYGRHGEAPLVVMAASSPADCFDSLLEAFRVAITYMTPVILLIDANIANSSEPWQRPTLSSIDIKTPQFNRFSDPFFRDDMLARNWPLPGTKGQTHRLGGLEKDSAKGNVTYDAVQHQAMVDLRAKKIKGVILNSPFEQVGVLADAAVLVISWGSTYGAVRTAVEALNDEGYSVGMLHLRALNPLPEQLADILKQHRQILVAELNMGQLLQRVRADYLVDAKGINQCSGQPFKVAFLKQRILESL